MQSHYGFVYAPSELHRMMRCRRSNVLPTIFPTSVVKQRDAHAVAARLPRRNQLNRSRSGVPGWAIYPIDFRLTSQVTRRSGKEVIQPQVPLRLPCYDFAPVTELALGRSLLAVGTRTSGTPGFHGVTGGVYKARERIHRGVADPRLLAIPTSCSRVTDCNPNLDRVFPIRSTSRSRNGLSRPL